MERTKLLLLAKSYLLVAVSGGVIGLAGLSSLASAATQCFATSPTGSCTDTAVAIGNEGTPVNATATFTVSSSSLIVTLTNLLANPTSVSQLISDVFFTLSGTNSGSGLQSAPVPLVTVADNGTFTTSSGTTLWLLSQFGSQYHLDVLAGPASGPANLIIGPPDATGIYSNANGSIAGNDPHNPLINQSATFALALTGLTGAETVSDVAISFGTTPSTIPIPAAVWLFGSGLIALIGIARRKRTGVASDPVALA